MTRKEIQNELQEVFDNLFARPVKVELKLTPSDVEEWDSIMHISIIQAVETRFGIRFDVGELDSIGSIGEWCDVIQLKLRRKTKAA
jgi:acyl carrier protein